MTLDRARAHVSAWLRVVLVYVTSSGLSELGKTGSAAADDDSVGWEEIWACLR